MSVSLYMEGWNTFDLCENVPVYLMLPTPLTQDSCCCCLTKDHQTLNFKDNLSHHPNVIIVPRGSQIVYLWPETDATIILNSQVNYKLRNSEVMRGIWGGRDGEGVGGMENGVGEWTNRPRPRSKHHYPTGGFYVKSSYKLWYDAE